MNIGILIFVISVIVTGISAMRDKSHEQRKNQMPPHKNTQSPTQNTPRKKGIFEQIEEAFNEMASEFDEEEQTKKTSSPKPSSKKETVHSDKNLKKMLRLNIIVENQNGLKLNNLTPEKCLLKIDIQLHERDLKVKKILKNS
ncbi:hypothetical protein [Staphylococcus hominis]|uniref:hypothetical protein n=1 Tax=Staphylococcus hominis TaxID=1290 RepID=UPI00398C6EA5